MRFPARICRKLRPPDTGECNSKRKSAEMSHKLLAIPGPGSCCEHSRHLQESPSPPGLKSPKRSQTRVCLGVYRKFPENTGRSLTMPKMVRGYFRGIFCRPLNRPLLRPFSQFRAHFGPGDLCITWRLGSQGCAIGRVPLRPDRPLFALTGDNDFETAATELEDHQQPELLQFALRLLQGFCLTASRLTEAHPTSELSPITGRKRKTWKF